MALGAFAAQYHSTTTQYRQLRRLNFKKLSNMMLNTLHLNKKTRNVFFKLSFLFLSGILEVIFSGFFNKQ